MAASGLTTFAFDYKSVLRSFVGLAAMFRGKRADLPEPPKEECPDWWFPAGFLVLGPVVVGAMGMLFEIPAWAGAIAVPLAVLMGFVAARVTGETDVTPTEGARPGDSAHLRRAHAWELGGQHHVGQRDRRRGPARGRPPTTLKTGKLLGASPKQQFMAQLVGVAAGALVVVPAFHLIILTPPCSVATTGLRPLVWSGLASLRPSRVASTASTLPRRRPF